MNEIKFIADTHFGHKRIIDYDNRPFPDLAYHDEALINHWNAGVDGGDIVYHLGDFSFHKAERTREIIDSLNGEIHLILGNHDMGLTTKTKNMFRTVGHLKEVTVEEVRFVLTHYPLRTWAGIYDGVFNLHGHSHGRGDPYEGALDMGCNLWGYFPVGVDNIMDKIIPPIPTKEQPNE